MANALRAVVVAALAGFWPGLMAQAPAAGAAETGAARPADATPPGKVYVYKESGGKPRELEVYFPPNHDPATAKVPGLLLFHGGGWSGGSLTQFRAACHYFASRGLVAVTAEYRMLTKPEAAALPAGETRKRVCITDAKSAIRWLKQHASELGVDPDRLITGGGSAGGHISLLATTSPGLDDPADPKEVDTRVVAYVLFNPALSPDDSKDAEVDALPHLHKDMAPAIAFFGTQDPWKKGWDEAMRRFTALGGRVPEVWLAEGQVHAFYGRPPWKTLTLIAADRFLAQHGLLQGEPTLAPPAGGAALVQAPATAAAAPAAGVP